MKNATPIGENAIDTFDPGVVSERIGFYKTLFRMFAVSTDGIIPCIVRKYDPDKGTVSAQPIVNNVMPTLNGDKQVERPVYEDVPVLHVCHGGFNVSIPLFIGDTGLLVALDRNCDTAISANSSALEKDQTGEDDKNEGPKAVDDLTTASFDHPVFIPFSFSPMNAEKGKLIIRKLGEDCPTIVIDDEKVQIKAGKTTAEIGKDGASIAFDGDRVSISKDGLKYSGKIDEKYEELADIRYDPSTRQLQKKSRPMKRRGDFVISGGDISDWTMCEGGQALPISTVYI